MKQIRKNQNRRRRRTSNKKVVMYSGRHVAPTKKRKLNMKKVVLVLIIFCALITLIVKSTKHDKTVETASNDNTDQSGTTNEKTENNENLENKVTEEPDVKPKKEITDWRLTLANYENILPDDFKVEVANIDDTKQFDARVIKYLNQMMNDMRKSGISNVWVQSAYRSVERQKELYNNSVQKYLKQGKTQEEAERLTEQYINKPGASDHNLGLAVDFNNVDNNFEDLKAFKWLKENAENYGFILRYPKSKESVTKIEYESWHWRFVGEEHAKKMNELNMCLEEYVEYLKNVDE